MNSAIATIEDSFQPVSTDMMVKQVQSIQHLMSEVMIDKTHYGTIPGCGNKPTLLKAGAEKLCLSFQLAPEYDIDERQLSGGHREYRIVCKLKSLRSGVYMGEGLGVCSTMEAKYRYRNGERKCPSCGKAAIIKGKEQYGGGWVCFKKKDGCGAKWDDGAQEIEGQVVGKIEHDNPADYYNTVIKMAKKRAQVDAVLTVTAASDIFTQDIEEMSVVRDDVIDTTVVEPVESDGRTYDAYIGSIRKTETASGVRGLMKVFSTDADLSNGDRVKLQLNANARMSEIKESTHA